MVIYKCDICGDEIPKIKRKDFLGREVEVLDIGFLKCEQLPTINKYGYPENFHMCKSCAEKQSMLIDYELMKFKTEVLSKCGGSMQEMRESGMTYKEIGNTCGMSKQRVHQLLNDSH